MAFVLQPWQLDLAILAGWINRQQQVLSKLGNGRPTQSRKYRARPGVIRRANIDKRDYYCESQLRVASPTL
jgi:hypothetical protein